MERERRLAIISSIVSILIPIVLTLFFIACKKDAPNAPDVIVDTQKPFADVPDLSEMVIYEVNPLAFGPDGTLADVESKLDHFKSLGTNVIWLMPIYPKGELKGVGSPYCVQDYTSVNPDYGTIDDLSNLVAAAHKKGMAVILDWVANHTSWDNDWINNDDWYVKDTNGNIIIPPGTTWNDVAELNFNNAEMRLEMIKDMKFWITECNIDGFRCDAVDFVPVDFWKQAIDSLKKMEDRNLILLGESGKTQSYSAGFQMIYAWDFQSKLKAIFSSGTKASAITATHKNEYQNIPSENQRLRYTTNHDIYAWEESPVKSFFNKQGSVTAFAITAFMGGVPLICDGQEIAHASTISFFNLNPIEWSINADILTAYKNIMKVRQANTLAITGALKSFDTDNVVSFSHTNGGEVLWVIANVRDTETTYQIPEEYNNDSWKNALDSTTVEISQTIALKPYEYLMLKNK